MHSVSVLICTRNRAPSLARTLDALLALDRTGIDDLELLVVDNGSSDGTARVVSDFSARAPFRTLAIREDAPGLSRARNAGLARASGELILFTDDDCIADPMWLRHMVAAFGSVPRQVIGGRIVLYNADHLDVTTRTATQPEAMTSVTQLFGFVMGANMAFGRCVLDDIGPFDERLGAGSPLKAAEDTEFVYRAFRAGIPCIYQPEPLVQHDHGRTGEAAFFSLTRGYYIGNGAMIAMDALKGRFDLVKPVYWDLVSAFNDWRAGQGSLRIATLRLATVIGFSRFVVFEAWRAPHAVGRAT